MRGFVIKKTTNHYVERKIINVQNAIEIVGRQ